MSPGQVKVVIQRHAERHTKDLGATVMDLTRMKGTCRSHVGDPSRRSHVIYPRHGRPTQGSRGITPTSGPLQIRNYRRN